MHKTIDRIMIFIRHLGISVRQFDISIGASNGYTLRMNKNNASVGSDVVENISKKYQMVNVEWLVTGRGTMIKASDKSLNLKENSSINEAVLHKMIDAKINITKQENFNEKLKNIIVEIADAQNKV